eukprot:g5913.t1
MSRHSSLALDRHAWLLDAINDGNVRRAEQQLDAGVDVNGLNPDFRPIQVAARCGHTRLIEMLARRGANLEAPVSHAVPDGYGGMALPRAARALHAAVMSKEPAALKAILDAGVDPNPRDADGKTPLLLAVLIRHSADVEMVRLLLNRGADPLLASNEGITPMHHAASRASVEMIDLIFAASPAALNLRCGRDAPTPLGILVSMGTVLMSSFDLEKIVRHLLSLGATEKDVPTEKHALVKVALQGDEGLVRIMLDAVAGRRAGKFWGAEALSHAVVMAASDGCAKIVKMLVTAEGESRQQHWARARRSDMSALCHAALSGSATTVAVLLAAGADELAGDNDGHRASDYAGMSLREGKINKRERTSAVKRTLARAPAHRARSWVWTTAVDAARGGRAGTGAGGTRESRLTPVGVRIFRPRNPRFFTTRFDRYSRKL